MENPTSNMAMSPFHQMQSPSNSVLRSNSTVMVRTAPAGIYQPAATHYVAPGTPLRNGMRSTYDIAHVPTFESRLEWVAAGDEPVYRKLEQVVLSQHPVYTVDTSDHQVAEAEHTSTYTTSQSVVKRTKPKKKYVCC
eukprot:GHVH01003676.1.p1 GENE.GHVH01003676.1~~GHVH01003676.1.p1  ORF type:complete len:151 (+),score=13.30 GHVH01003676.1:43-453(+)